MSRETKFGYGFLLAGVGLPYLIEKLLGPLAALIIAAVCVVSGISLLAAGHFHREKEPVGFKLPAKRTVPVATTIALIAAVAISLAWAVKGFIESQIGQDQPQIFLSRKSPLILPPLFAYDHTPKPDPGPHDIRPPRLNQPLESHIQLSAVFYDPISPTIVVSNPSDRVAEGVTWGMVAFRTSDLSYFGFATQSVGYIKARSESARYSLDLPKIQKTSDGNGQIVDGDELTGSVSVDCPQCDIQTYIVHFVWGHTGWFFESPKKAGYLVPKDMSKDGRMKYIQLLTNGMSAKDKTDMKPKPH